MVLCGGLRTESRRFEPGPGPTGQEWVGHGSGAGQLGQPWYFVGAYALKVDDLSRARGLRVRSGSDMGQANEDPEQTGKSLVCSRMLVNTRTYMVPER